MAAVTRKRGAENYFVWGLSGEELSKLNISSQSKAQRWLRKRKTELKIIEKIKICIPAMLKPYSASSFCLPNKNRVGVAHGDGTNLEVVYTVSTSSDFQRKKRVNEKLGTLYFDIPPWSGELAHMVERSLSMREVPGSIPGFSRQTSTFLSQIKKLYKQKAGPPPLILVFGHFWHIWLIDWCFLFGNPTG